MNNQKKYDTGFSNFGFSTILLAFVMICIVTLSAVSLLTANSDYKLSKKVAEKNTDYYEAEAKAYLILEEIDMQLSLAYQTSEDAAGYYRNCKNRLSDLGYGTYTTDETDHTYSYSVSVTDGQYLLVVLDVQYPTNDNEAFFQILSWQSKYETTIHEDEPLDLFQ